MISEYGVTRDLDDLRKKKLPSSNRTNIILKTKKAKKKRKKRFSSPFKGKRKSKSKLNPKSKLSRGPVARDSRGMIPNEVFFHDPMVYSSVIYKYHNNNAQKVGTKMSQLRRAILSDIKTHSQEKRAHLPSFSRSLKKFKQNTPWKRTYGFQSRRPKPNVRASARPKALQQPKFQSSTKGSVYEIIKTMDKTPPKHRPWKMNPLLSGQKKRNFSSSKKASSIKSKYSFEERSGKKNYSLNLLKKSPLKSLKKKSSSGTNFFGPNLKKKKAKLRVPSLPLGKMKSKVHQEYNFSRFDLNRRYKKVFSKYAKRNLKKPVTLKPSFSGSIDEKSEKHPEPHKININLDQIRSSKNDSEERNGIQEFSEGVQESLLTQLKESQKKNDMFMEIISDLRHQIKQLKGQKLQSFSFKNLSHNKAKGSPTPESGRIHG